MANAKAADSSVDTEPAAQNTKPAVTDKSILSRKAKGELVQKIKTEKTGVMNPIEYEQTKQMARDFVASKSVPASFTNEHQVLMALLAGRELGMTPIESLQAMYLVNGKLSIYGAARARQLRRLGWALKFEDKPNACTASITKLDDGDSPESYTETVTFEECEQSGYTKDSYGKLKFGWKEGMNRRKKLRYMAVDLLVDSYVAEAKGGVIGTKEVVEDAPAFDNPVNTEDNIRKALADRQTGKDALTPTEDTETETNGDVQVSE